MQVVFSQTNLFCLSHSICLVCKMYQIWYTSPMSLHLVWFIIIRSLCFVYVCVFVFSVRSFPLGLFVFFIKLLFVVSTICISASVSIHIQYPCGTWNNEWWYSAHVIISSKCSLSDSLLSASLSSCIYLLSVVLRVCTKFCCVTFFFLPFLNPPLAFNFPMSGVGRLFGYCISTESWMFGIWPR